jgi:hypothetical protein
MKNIVFLFLCFTILNTGCEAQHDSNDGKTSLPVDFTPVLNTPGTPVKPRNGAFTVAVLPDTQYYLSGLKGGTPEMFKSQVQWIKENQEKENIVYVAHVGDLTEHGDNPAYAFSEWDYAQDIMYELENPVSIPYGIAVGNHDQFPSQYPVSGTTNYYNKYFGVKHFEGRPYYGGHYGGNNDSHYDLFSAGEMDFIVMYIEYDAFNEDQYNMNKWAVDILNKYSDRKAIVISHFLIYNNSIAGTNEGAPGSFGQQGKVIYDNVKNCPNVFMMLCGHIGDNGEGYREDTFNGHTIRTFLNNYQSRTNGGNGLMRLYRFSVEQNQLEIKTFSPFTNTFETDADSQFTTELFN